MGIHAWMSFVKSPGILYVREQYQWHVEELAQVQAVQLQSWYYLERRRSFLLKRKWLNKDP